MANHMARRRPNQSPNRKFTMHPEKHPRLYIETIIPVRLSFGWPMVSR